MIARHAEVVVDASPDACLEVIRDVEAYPRWVKGYRSVAVHERDGAGLPALVRYAVGGLGMSASYTLAYEHGPETVGFRQVRGDLTRAIDGRYVVSRNGSETRVRFEAEVELAVRAPGVVRRVAERIVLDAALRGLRDETARREVAR